VETHDLGLAQLSLNNVALLPPAAATHEMQVQYCTEAWPSSSSRHVYDVVFLCVVYVLPGTLTVALYARIGTTLWATDQALARQNSYVTNEGKIVSLYYITKRAEFNIYK
jgi:hypothetical protein